MAIILLLTTKDSQTIELPVLGKCTVGRSGHCEMTVEDGQMSGKHGVFEFNNNGQLFYTDLGSTNGSYLNNNRIQKIQFKINETLRLGNTIITIDEKRLNPREKIAIGSGAREDKTIVIPGLQEVKSPPPLPVSKKDDEPTSQRKSVVLNKDLKKKVPKANWTGGSNKENLIEQEESSGKTKFLKLDINKIKKKT